MTDILLRIDEVLTLLRPSLQQHQGDIEFVSYQDGVLTIKFLGACVSCPFSFYTFTMGLEEKIKQHVPEVKKVVLYE